MNIGRMFASAVVRPLSFVVVAAVLAFAGIGNSYAATCGFPSLVEANQAAGINTLYATKEAAYAACQAAGPFGVDMSAPVQKFQFSSCRFNTQGLSNRLEVVWNRVADSYGSGCTWSAFTGSQTSVYMGWQFSSECSAGKIWDEATKTCKEGCASKPKIYAGFHAAGPTFCTGGCSYGKDPAPTAKYRGDTPAGNQIDFQRGSWTPTGASCPTDEPTPPPKDDYCFITEGGHKICKDTQDRTCVTSAKTGRRYCPDGPNAPLVAANPNRTESINISAPSPVPGTAPPPIAPRPGETFTPGGVTSITNITNSTTTNTTISNNTGAPNVSPGSGGSGDGGGNGGTPPGGAGNGGPGEEGEGDGDKGTSSGGDTCAAPPTTTGDAVGGMIAYQSWLSRCRGADDLNADGIPDFLAEPQDETFGNTNGADDGWFNGEDVIPSLDVAGFGLGRSCPAPPVVSFMGVTRTIDTEAMCSLASIIAAIILAAAFVQAAYILAGNK